MRTHLPLAIAGIALMLGSLMIIQRFFPLTSSASTNAPRSEHAQESDGSGSYFVSIFDNGEKITMRSDAITVRELLERAEISYKDEDIIEPALDTKINEDGFNINVYRARELVVIDGHVRKYVRTAATAPEAVVTAAGFTLREADLVEIASFDNVLESGMTVAYHIKRAKTIKLNLFGKYLEVRTQADTVADFLREQGVKLDSSKNWSPLAPDTKLTDNLELTVYHQGKQTITAEEDVPFEETITKDYSLDSGKTEIIKAGAVGKKTVTYEIEMYNGQEISRKTLSEVITQTPVAQEKRVGAKAVVSGGTLPSGSHEDWMAAAGIAASDYGYVNYIISHESGWRPNAVSGNGYYHGLYQTNLKSLSSQCPNWQNDPVCQLRAASNYKNRYGTWADAYAAWKRQGWW